MAKFFFDKQTCARVFLSVMFENFQTSRMGVFFRRETCFLLIAFV